MCNCGTGCQETLTAQLNEMKVYLDRKFAEVRSDATAFTELSDMQSSEILSKIGDLVGQMAAKPSPDDQGGPGLELESVARLSALAANKIMDAAEVASELATSADVPPALRDALLGQMSVIFEACGFADMTGQRITRALETLRNIEEGMLGRRIPVSQQPAHVSQGDIDAMFGTAA